MLQGDTGELYPKVTVRVQISGGIESLRQILYQLATGQPLLITDNLLIQQRNRSGVMHAGHQTDTLDIRVDVTAYIYRAGGPL